MHAVYRRYGVNTTAAWISAACFLIACVLGFAEIAFPIFGSYLVIFLGTVPNFTGPIIAKHGDISYGMYLFGWPVEQIVRQLTHTPSPILLFLMAVPLTAVFAYASCHLVERPAMRLRKPVADQINKLVDRVLGLARVSRQGAIWGAEIAVVAAGTFYLLSPRLSWFVLTTVGVVAIAGLAGALVTGVVVALFSAKTRRARIT